MPIPVNQPSRPIPADGKAKLVISRRDVAGNAPNRIDVHVSPA